MPRLLVGPMDAIKIDIKEGKPSINGNLLHVENIVVKKVIGKGANGIVFYGIDEILNREVAVKVWVQNKKDNRNKLNQGLREARKISALKHPNIVTAYSAQIHDDAMLTLTTEYLNGITLCDYLRRNQNLNSRIRIWRKIAGAMTYAHSHGLYHGDLHSKNVMIISEEPIIIDFGTSFFSKSRSHKTSKKRESTLLTKLVTEMFPEWDGALLSVERILDYPEMALNQCIKWVFLFEHYGYFLGYLEKYSDAEDNISLRNEMGNIGMAIAQCPTIKRLDVLKLLQQHNLPEWSIREFLYGCIDMAKLELMDGPVRSVSRSVDADKGIKRLLEEFDKLAEQVMLKHLSLCKENPAKYLSEVMT